MSASALETTPGLVSSSNAPLSDRGWPINTQAEATIALQGLPAFKMKLAARGPIEVGERTTYTIDVHNTGSLPGSGVQVVGVVPGQLRVLSAGLPFRMDGPKVIFNPLPILYPGQSVRYVIEVAGVLPGDARFRVELSCSTLKQLGGQGA